MLSTNCSRAYIYIYTLRIRQNKLEYILEFFKSYQHKEVMHLTVFQPKNCKLTQVNLKIEYQRKSTVKKFFNSRNFSDIYYCVIDFQK